MSGADRADQEPRRALGQGNDHLTGHNFGNATCDHDFDDGHPLQGLAKRTETDKGAPFEPEILVALWELREGYHPEFQRLLDKLRQAGCRIGDLRKKVNDVDATQRSSRGRVNGSGVAAGYRSEPAVTQVGEGDASSGEIDLDDLMRLAPEGIGLTESDTADAFVELAADRLRFDQARGKWFIWTGTHWREDDHRLAFEAVRRLAMRVSERLDSNTKLLRDIRKASFARGVETLARVDKRVSVVANDWDRDPDLLGTPGGTIHLPTGLTRPADPSDMISRLTRVAPSFEPPTRWLKFLTEAMSGDADMIRFLQQWSGYALTGHNREEKLLFTFGPGGNGKGTFLLVISKLAHDYHKTASMTVFVASDYERHTTDLAMLAGARMVIAQEAKQGRKWDEERIKTLTGGDEITARFMRQDNFTFVPQFTLTMSGNDAPVLDNVDDAMRRRIRIAPFINKPKRVDDRLKQNLLDNEGPQILGWMINGAVDWYANGLATPEVSRKATEAYFDEQNTLERWIKEECGVGIGEEDMLEKLYQHYLDCQRGDARKPLSRNKFSDALAALGFRRQHTKYGSKFYGIRAHSGDYHL